MYPKNLYFLVQNIGQFGELYQIKKLAIDYSGSNY
jgi:hypothetical protein